jgi:molecular chaperone GrpE
MSSGNPFSKDPSAPDKGNGNAEGGVPAAESLEEQVGALTAKLDEVETEKRELQERLLRGAAELDNYKKRMRREQTDAARYAAEPLIRDLLSVVDNLELAVSHAGNDRGSALLEGVTFLRSFRTSSSVTG